MLETKSLTSWMVGLIEGTKANIFWNRSLKFSATNIPLDSKKLQYYAESPEIIIRYSMLSLEFDMQVLWKGKQPLVRAKRRTPRAKMSTAIGSYSFYKSNSGAK